MDAKEQAALCEGHKRAPEMLHGIIQDENTLIWQEAAQGSKWSNKKWIIERNGVDFKNLK